jgi:hypothetical protein
MDKNIVLDLAGNMNEWYMVNLPNLFKYLPSLFKTFNCLDAFLQMFEIWELNLSSKSTVTPSNFTSFSHLV